MSSTFTERRGLIVLIAFLAAITVLGIFLTREGPPPATVMTELDSIEAARDSAAVDSARRHFKKGRKPPKAERHDRSPRDEKI